jgi:hypothetical protein
MQTIFSPLLSTFSDLFLCLIGVDYITSAEGSNSFTAMASKSSAVRHQGEDGIVESSACVITNHEYLRCVSESKILAVWVSIYSPMSLCF